jgi:hypothetical protein
MGAWDSDGGASWARPRQLLGCSSTGVHLASPAPQKGILRLEGKRPKEMRETSECRMQTAPPRRLLQQAKEGIHHGCWCRLKEGVLEDPICRIWGLIQCQHPSVMGLFSNILNQFWLSPHPHLVFPHLLIHKTYVTIQFIHSLEFSSS